MTEEGLARWEYRLTETFSENLYPAHFDSMAKEGWELVKILELYAPGDGAHPIKLVWKRHQR